jgi:hypothetical protein
MQVVKGSAEGTAEKKGDWETIDDAVGSVISVWCSSDRCPVISRLPAVCRETDSISVLPAICRETESRAINE